MNYVWKISDIKPNEVYIYIPVFRSYGNRRYLGHPTQGCYLGEQVLKNIAALENGYLKGQFVLLSMPDDKQVISEITEWANS